MPTGTATYVGQEIHPSLGFVTGWGMVMDYLLNPLICTILCAQLALNLAPGVPYVIGHPHDGVSFFSRPFYDPSTFRMRSVLGGTSLAVLTYIGFDGISTLSEEAKNPQRDVLWATVLVCLIIGVLAACEVYAAQLVWPLRRAKHPSPSASSRVNVVLKTAILLCKSNAGPGLNARASFRRHALRHPSRAPLLELAPGLLRVMAEYTCYPHRNP